MNTNLRKYTYLIGLTTALFAVGCSDDIDPEITELITDRVFSPINVEAKIRNKTSVELTWQKSSKVDSYTVELFINDSLAFNGSPVNTYTDIKDENIPYTISKLDGETRYSARIKALSANATDSKWTGVTFKTEAEQIFFDVADEDLKATEVTLRWPAGEAADIITLKPGDIIHNLTAEEIAAGAVTLSNLTGETAYTAVMKRGEKTRGTAKFTTPVDLGGAIPVTPEDNVVEMIAAANDGDVFAFYPGEYNLGKTPITQNISFKAVRKNEKPVLKALISLEAAVNFTLKEVILDGTGVNAETGANGDQAIQFNTEGITYGDIVVDGCEIRNWLKGILYLNKSAIANSVTINDCKIYNIECSGGDFFDCRLGTPKTITFTNNTVYNSADARDLFRIDDKSADFPGVAPVILIDHNTFYSVANNTSKRILYVRWKGNAITFTNNIIANTAGYYTNQSATNIELLKNNNYFQANGFIENATTGAKVDDSGTFTTLDPGFANAASGDFTISNQTLIDNGAGDPRWIK